MVNIEEHEGKDHIFASGFVFERSQEIRHKLSECTADELFDLNLYLLSKLEGLHGMMENGSEKLGKILGWYGV